MLASVKTRRDPAFGFDVVTECPGVPSAILQPRDTWADKTAYDATAKKLAGTVHRELPAIPERRWRAGQGGIARRVNGLLRRKIARCSYAYEHGIDKPEIVRWKWLINLLNARAARHTKLAHIQTVPKGQNSEAAPLPLQKPANVLRAGFHSVHFTSKLSVVAKFFFDSQ